MKKNTFRFISLTAKYLYFSIKSSIYLSFSNLMRFFKSSEFILYKKLVLIKNTFWFLSTKQKIRYLTVFSPPPPPPPRTALSEVASDEGSANLKIPEREFILHKFFWSIKNPGGGFLQGRVGRGFSQVWSKKKRGPWGGGGENTVHLFWAVDVFKNQICAANIFWEKRIQNIIVSREYIHAYQ